MAGVGIKAMDRIRWSGNHFSFIGGSQVKSYILHLLLITSNRLHRNEDREMIQWVF